MLYAFHNNFPLYYVAPDLPFRFDDNIGSHYSCSNDLALWQQLHLRLTLNGLIPLSSKASSLTIDDHILKATTNNSRVIRVHFDKIIMFDPFGVQGLPALVEREHDSTIIYDWFNLLRSGPIDITKPVSYTHLTLPTIYSV